MDMEPSEERRSEFRKCIEAAMESNVLNLEDMQGIIDICLTASKREAAGLEEEILADRFREE